MRHKGTISLPQDVADDIAFVSGLSQFFHFPRRRVQLHHGAGHTDADPSSSSCGGSEGQDCFVALRPSLRALYNVSSEFSTRSAKTSVGVAEFPPNFAIGDASLAKFGVQIGSKASPLAINRRGGKPNAGSQPAQRHSLTLNTRARWETASPTGCGTRKTGCIHCAWPSRIPPTRTAGPPSFPCPTPGPRRASAAVSGEQSAPNWA